MSGDELLKRTGPDADCHALKMRKKGRKEERKEGRKRRRKLASEGLHETLVLRSEIWLPT